jgi:hypothetical protein
MGAGMATRTRAGTAAVVTAGVRVGQGRTVVAGAAAMTALATRGDETVADLPRRRDPTPLVDGVEDDEEKYCKFEMN